MFGWFAPVCPTDLHQKIWVERRLVWLLERFGSERILKAPRILPTREFFPDPYQGTDDDLPSLLRRICHFMGADDKRFEIQLFSGEERPDPLREGPGILGLYDNNGNGVIRIWLSDSLLPDQEAVIATLAHEVAHDLLLGAGLLTGEEPDHEQLTDLLPVALGMGTFHANTAVKQNAYSSGGMAYWSIRRSGYLTAMTCGYAMGVIEWLRGTTNLPSLAYLGKDAAVTLKAGLKYLQKTGDCLIDPAYPAHPIAIPRWHEDTRATASRCLYALEIGRGHDLSSTEIEAVLTCLNRPEPVIQVAAIKLLENVVPRSQQISNVILAQLHSPHDPVRECATTAVGKLQLPLTHVTSEGPTLLELLTLLTRDTHRETAVAAAIVLGTYGSAAGSAVPGILPLLVTAIARHSAFVEPLFASVENIVGNIKTYLNQNPSVISTGHVELIQEGLRVRGLNNRRLRTEKHNRG